MKLRVLGAALLSLCVNAALGQGGAKPGDPLASIAWLAGGVWRAEVPSPTGSGTTKIEQKMERTLGGRVMRFETSFDGTQEYQGFFAYDATKKKVVFSYPSASGDVTNGEVAEGTGEVLLDFTVDHSQGAATHYQVHMKRTGPDDYTWGLFSAEGSGWKPMFQVKYHRA